MDQLFKVLAEHFQTDHVEIASLGAVSYTHLFPESHLLLPDFQKDANEYPPF